jgi:heme exporter protein D
MYNAIMILFKVFHIRKILKGVHENPSKLAGEEAGDALWDIVLIPLIILVGGIILFFILGYTNVFRFHLGFFKFLFWLSLIVSILIFSIIRRIIKSVSKTTTIHTENILKPLSPRE